jgi:hypothetical protein
MSKKYVPSFLKDQQSTSTQNTNSFGQNTTTPNRFAALADDFKRDKPIVNTSLPAKEAPKLVPMTLASLTSKGGATPVASSSGGPKKSFAAKFAEQAKHASDPNYKPPPKPVDFTSADDFPALGAPKKAAAGAWGAKPVVNTVVEDEKPAVVSFADKAKEWANKRAEEEEKARLKAINDERLRRDADIIKTMSIIRLSRRQDYNDDNDEEEYNPNYDESSLGDDSYEMPEDDQEPSEEEEEDEDEFNQNVGWDGRRKDDLY